MDGVGEIADTANSSGGSELDAKRELQSASRQSGGRLLKEDRLNVAHVFYSNITFSHALDGYKRLKNSLEHERTSSAKPQPMFTHK
jgi:hypothetical protein